MKPKVKKILRQVLIYLGLCFGIIVLAITFLVWINLSGRQENKEILASLPNKITPKYDTDKGRNWWKETAVYQIYPRSFMDSDGDGIGDINGIISKLDYIKFLGFETIWISPFYKSPQFDHGYDISDYKSIQPEYGDLNKVDSLISEVHLRDMKIVFDLVLNHTSDQHPWFIESKRSRNNPRSDWYVWKDGKGDGPPNNWKNILGQISAWNYVPERDQYYYAAFLPAQPDLNMANPEVRTEMINIVQFWLDKGVDGFRLDIFNFIFEDENYPDNPRTLRYLPKLDEAKWIFEEHRYNFHQPEVIEFARELRTILESYPEGRFMVGEVFGSHKHMRELLGLEYQDGLNLVFLFDFIEGFDFSADYFREKVEEYESFYPAPLVPTYVFSNHDQLRSITRLDNDERKADILAAFQLTMRGVPFVYQGEEIGMRTGNIPITEAQDPLAKNWLEIPEWIRDKLGFLTNRDNCRTPMQWNNELSAGFSASKNTWLPVQENYEDINVMNQLEDRNSLLNTYKSMLALRKKYTVLQNGAISFIDQKELPENVLGFSRHNTKKRLTVYLNLADQQYNFNNALIEMDTTLISKRSNRIGSEIELNSFGILITSD